jgi:hypothetical protein
LPDRDAVHRGLSRKIANDQEKTFDYAGSGMAIDTLIDSTVRVTIRHSDTAPTASVAATACVTPDAGAERISNPAAAPGDRFMAEKLLQRGANHPQPQIYRWNRWPFCGGGSSKMAETRRAE